MNTKDFSALEASTQLLESLNRMQADNVSPQIRLAHIQESSPSRSSEEQGAQELELCLSRIQSFANLAADVQTLVEKWSFTSLDSPVKDAGLSLLGHLERILDEQRKVYGRDEISFLSRMWESGPDLRELYPWMSPGTPFNHVVMPSSYDTGIRHPKGEGNTKIATDKQESLSEDTSSEQPPVVSVDEPSDDRERVLASSNAIEVELDNAVDKVDEEALAEPDALTAKIWTEALIEETAMNWQFSEVHSQGSRVSMKWILPNHNLSDVRLEIARLPKERVQVMLRVIDGAGQIERAATVIPLEVLSSLYENPGPFIKTLVAG